MGTTIRKADCGQCGWPGRCGETWGTAYVRRRRSLSPVYWREWRSPAETRLSSRPMGSLAAEWPGAIDLGSTCATDRLTTARPADN